MESKKKKKKVMKNLGTNKNKDADLLENRLVVAKEEGVGEGWSGSLGLADAN